MSDNSTLDRASWVITEGLSPAAVAAAIVAMVAWDSTPTATSAVTWGMTAIVFGAAIPLGFLLFGKRAGWWGDHHVSDGAKRRWPLAVCLLSVATGAGIGVVFNGPLDLMILAAVMCAVLAVVWLITDKGGWKVSVHSVVAVTGAAIATLLYGAWAALLVWPLALLVGWSRVQLKAHTRAQVLVGALLGGLAAVAFAVLR
ncbi:phosphatase PAP2 family protein [Nocardiopsis exhalans]|uniref:Phosphatase PAP2 family protein n=1 Tax=Nocardiopsis exhalans TaxID=163604 RepID=A0ABY5DBT8_9ACTN|nr:phosphatase PAP2 family protein [Nocardiopsis exhalans]USY21809.1 phosphatase PAP2 family protein [Nocardiopsis exhalans]